MTCPTTLTSSNHRELNQARGLSQHLTNHTAEFLKAFGLTHAWIGKYYFDGRYVEVTNDLTWKEQMLEHNFYDDFVTNFIAPLLHQQSKNLFLTWQTDLSSKIGLIHGIHDYGIFSGFNIIRVYPDHVENYGFGSTHNIQSVSCLLPSREDLDMFCLYIRENIWLADNFKAPLLGNIGKSFSPTSFLGQPKGYRTSVPKTFSFECNNQTKNLSHQQIICLGLLAQGYGVKDIGRTMNLSPRTVEFYIAKLKYHFNDCSTSKLITTFNDSSLSCVNPHMLLGNAKNTSLKK